jgi:hypothetical protein
MGVCDGQRQSDPRHLPIGGGRWDRGPCSRSEVRDNGNGGVGDGTFALFQRSFTVAGGLTAEEKVSTAFSQVPDTRPSNFDSVMGECYMGDYNQVTPGEAGALLHSWGDNRNAAMGNHPGRRTPASSTAF